MSDNPLKSGRKLDSSFELSNREDQCGCAKKCEDKDLAGGGAGSRNGTTPLPSLPSHFLRRTTSSLPFVQVPATRTRVPGCSELTQWSFQ